LSKISSIAKEYEITLDFVLLIL